MTKEWRKGFACAVAIMAKIEGMTNTTIEETFECAFMDAKELEKIGVPQSDIETLIPVIESIRKRNT